MLAYHFGYYLSEFNLLFVNTVTLTWEIALHLHYYNLNNNNNEPQIISDH